MLTPLMPPLSVEGLEVRPVVCDEHPTLLSSVVELLSIGHAAVRTPNLVDRDRIHPTRAQPLRDARAHVFVEEEAQARSAWLSAIRASISSGYAS